MNVLMIGGTGLLGSEAARELIKRGHSITSMALPPVPPGAELPAEMKIEFGTGEPPALGLVTTKGRCFCYFYI